MIFEALAAEHGDRARFLHLEMGRALLRLGRREEGAAALRQVLAVLPSHGGDGARIHAHVALAEVAIEAGDDGAAERELRSAAEVAPDLTAGHLRLGQFLRARGRHREAADVLAEAARTMGELRPDVRVLREIGLNQAALGDEDSAVTTLEAIVDNANRPYALWVRTPEPVDWRRVTITLSIAHVVPGAGCPSGYAYRRRLELAVAVMPNADGSGAFLTGSLVVTCTLGRMNTLRRRRYSGSVLQRRRE